MSEVRGRLACACPVVCYILHMIQWHGGFPSCRIVHAPRFRAAIFFPPSSESCYGSFSTDIFQCDGCLFLFPFCLGLMATIPIIMCWNTSRKHNINLVISWIHVLCPSCSRNVVSGVCLGTNVFEINIESDGKKKFASVSKIMTGNEGCAIVPPMGALFHLKAGCQKWKLLDTSGTQPPLSVSGNPWTSGVLTVFSLVPWRKQRCRNIYRLRLLK